jgi:hypothetical protein
MDEKRRKGMIWIGGTVALLPIGALIAWAVFGNPTCTNYATPPDPPSAADSTSGGLDGDGSSG